MIEWDDEQLEAEGIDKKKLERAIQYLEKAGKLLDSMNIGIFASPGTAFLHFIPISLFYESGDRQDLNEDAILAWIINGSWDGGDP